MVETWRLLSPPRKNPDTYQHLPQEDSQYLMASRHQQPRTVATNEITTCRRWHCVKTLEMDLPHPPQACILYHKASTHLEPSGEKEKMSTMKHMVQRPRGRHDEEWLHMSRVAKTGPGPWWLEGYDWPPILEMGLQVPNDQLTQQMMYNLFV